mmetsp:Transcript_63472/g.125538  ORF Transcript_63472/g.125538 Transcript_63472/m.125538 type:complete len:205 (-) Transcript_63472:154-768(-)
MSVATSGETRNRTQPSSMTTSDARSSIERRPPKSMSATGVTTVRSRMKRHDVLTSSPYIRKPGLSSLDDGCDATQDGWSMAEHTPVSSLTCILISSGRREPSLPPLHLPLPLPPPLPPPLPLPFPPRSGGDSIFATLGHIAPTRIARSSSTSEALAEWLAAEREATTPSSTAETTPSVLTAHACARASAIRAEAPGVTKPISHR